MSAAWLLAALVVPGPGGEVAAEHSAGATRSPLSQQRAERHRYQARGSNRRHDYARQDRGSNRHHDHARQDRRGNLSMQPRDRGLKYRRRGRDADNNRRYDGRDYGYRAAPGYNNRSRRDERGYQRNSDRRRFDRKRHDDRARRHNNRRYDTPPGYHAGDGYRRGDRHFDYPALQRGPSTTRPLRRYQRNH